MKVLLVNTYDIGGAANACHRLHKGLLEQEVDSKVLLAHKQKSWQNSFLFKKSQGKPSMISKINVKLLNILKELKLYNKEPNSKKKSFLNNRSKGLELFSFPDSILDITESELYNDADIVNLHWVANFLDYKSFFEKNKKPVVWTLHDMNSFSGGEHYEEKYLGIDAFGFPISRVVTDEEKRIAKENIKIKKQAVVKIDNLTIVAPSEWLAAQARASEVFKNKPVFCIPNGLDSAIYTPRDKEYSRALFNIPGDKTVILFVADFIDNNRKGFDILKRAIEQLANPNLVLCSVGNKNSNFNSINGIFELGAIYDERLMSAAYSAADVFVIPSIMDNLPNTVLESLMCGTPVIGFPVGGISELIEDGVNGLLTKEISVTALLDTMINFLNSAKKFDRKKIRKDAIMNYDIKIQSSHYIKLFESIIN